MTMPPVVPDPGWTDVAGFWVSLAGTIASTVIAAVAIWVTTSGARKARKQSERDKRADWARDFNVWMDAGRVHMLTGISDALDADWNSTGSELSARADVVGFPGAKDLMVSAKDARVFVSEITDPDLQFDLMRFATSLIKLWATQWVDDPKGGELPMNDWLEGYKKSKEQA